jgi:excisionase family DNA binding protein
MNTEKYFLPIEVAEKYRYSKSFVYFLVRKKKIASTKIGRHIRIPGNEVCRVFCKGTGTCSPCPLKKNRS